MAALDLRRGVALRHLFLRAETIIAEPPSTAVPSLPGRVTIVVLGYALNDNGGMEKPLLERLEATLAAARANPLARIVVTGGQPHSGVTEADVMTRWLVAHGVDRDRVQIEDKAKDTVGNVLNTAGLLSQAPPDAVLLVTSATHMRRARLLLETAIEDAGLHVRLTGVAADANGAAPPSTDERMAIYRDALRVSGIWAYPGLQR
jgi:uncharacterized SAM-binding protein YcdF (DUF218 family)